MTGGKLFRMLETDFYIENVLREKRDSLVDDKCVMTSREINDILRLLYEYREIISKIDYEHGKIPSDAELNGR